MTKQAAIAAQLVDVRNVNTHKCVRMTIDVPAEQAIMVVEAFGWPTQANPVPVAIARLDPSKNKQLGGNPPSEPADPDKFAARQDRPVKPRKPVASDKRLAQQAGILCSNNAFQAFMFENEFAVAQNEESVAAGVRLYCGGITSRAEIVPGTAPAERWIDLRGRFDAWMSAAA